MQDTASGALPNIYHRSRQTRRTVHLTFGKNSAVPFLVMTSHPGDDPDGEPIKLDQVGISHFSFTVPDTSALAAELMAKGVKFAGTLADSTDAQGNIRSFFVYDPDMTRI